jgi:hypothetical protein
MAEISHSASGSPTKGLEYLSFSGKKPVFFAALFLLLLLLFNPLTDFPCSFACAGSFEMDKESSLKLIASLHETHLKRTKNLPLPNLAGGSCSGRCSRHS